MHIALLFMGYSLRQIRIFAEKNVQFQKAYFNLFASYSLTWQGSMSHITTAMLLFQLDMKVYTNGDTIPCVYSQNEQCNNVLCSRVTNSTVQECRSL